jgi:hypothetical protein
MVMSHQRVKHYMSMSLMFIVVDTTGDGLLAPPAMLTPPLGDHLKVLIVLGPGIDGEVQILLLSPADVLGPITHVLRVWVGETVQLAERGLNSRAVVEALR